MANLSLMAFNSLKIGGFLFWAHYIFLGMLCRFLWPLLLLLYCLSPWGQKWIE